MKRIEKTGQVGDQLRRAYGPDANLEPLAVYEVVLANTQPLRKTGGLFKGARLTASLVSDIAAAVNNESIPLQLQHDTQPLPVGRLFAATVQGDEARGLIAVDEVVRPDIVASLDSGTVDQVSVGMVNKQLLCSKCGFDYANPKSYENRYELSCDKDHKIGDDGTYVQVTGLDSLFETSLVGQGAVRGARVVSPSQSAFQNNAQLRASIADGSALALLLSPTIEDSMDPAAFTAQLTAAVTAKTVAETQLSTVTSERDLARGERDTARTELATSTANLATITGERDTATTALTAMTGERDAANTNLTAATDALRTEATTILTACGKQTEIEALTAGKDATALLQVINDHRAQFAAAVPVGGAGSRSDATPLSGPRSNGAFRSPRR